MPKPDYYHEKQISSSGFKLIAGIDEVGRGTLAGPVVAGVIIIEIKNLLESGRVKDVFESNFSNVEHLKTFGENFR